MACTLLKPTNHATVRHAHLLLHGCSTCCNTGGITEIIMLFPNSIRLTTSPVMHKNTQCHNNYYSTVNFDLLETEAKPECNNQ